MTLNFIVPRIALLLVFLAGLIFSYAESTYVRDHAAALGPKGADITMWMWAYRAFALAFLFAFAFVLGSFFRR